MRYGAPPEIHNPEAYEAAKRRRIYENARISHERNWLGFSADRKALIAKLEGHYNGERPDSFMTKMYNAFLTYGWLTDKQEAAVRRALGEADARTAERAERRAAEHTADVATSGYVGTVGERRVFTATVNVVLEFEGEYGMSYRHIMHDSDGNVITYKGTKRLAERHETVTFKATIKAHEVYKDVKQTVVARPADVTVHEDTTEEAPAEGATASPAAPETVSDPVNALNTALAALKKFTVVEG